MSQLNSAGSQHDMRHAADINTPPNYAFEQRSPREFFMNDVDGSPLQDGCELTLYKYPQLEFVGKTRTVRHEVTCPRP